MLDFYKSKLWNKLEQECKDHMELDNIQKMCKDAIEYVKIIRDTFPSYTLHDEVHIENVLQWMELLLGDSGIEQLSIGECAMLLLAAHYHDVGMCYSKEQKENELKSARFNRYLNENPKEYLEVEKYKEEGHDVPEEIQLNYFRKIHHLRVNEFLPLEWKVNSVRRDRLIEICKSHGESIEECLVNLQYDQYLQTDYILCAILLRLSDVLDFDLSRAPFCIYELQKISESRNPFSDIEWRKHQASKGFKIVNSESKILSYRAVCYDMQSEVEITKFLDYIDEELSNCNSVLAKNRQERWKNLVIPKIVNRNIERIGYQTGEYCLTLEADKVLELLVGDDLYSDDATFIRELLQNALDAVRARKAIDYTYAENKNVDITLSEWIDDQGYQWFRVDDNGIGMTEKMIMNYFLRVGKSYYQSDEFKKINQENRQHYDFNPISQFGIGILSCFINGDKMEVSTRHYKNGNGLRFSMNGIKGYYSLAAEEKGDKGTIMPSLNEQSSSNFRQTAGTSIAVRLKESLEEDILSSVKKYLCYPDISVKFRKQNETITFLSEQELMEFARENRRISLSFPQELMDQINNVMPEIVWEDRPYICMKCTLLDELSESPFMSGVDFQIEAELKHDADEDIVVDDINIKKELTVTINVTDSCIRILIYYDINCFDKTSILSLEQVKERYIRKYYTDIKRYEDLFNGKKSIEEILRKIPIKAEQGYIEGIYNKWEIILRLMKQKKAKVDYNMSFSNDAAIKTAIERFIIPRCNQGTQFLTNHLVEIVYNGIVVDKSWDAYEYVADRSFRYTVLLLTKDFQPKLGIDRERIRYFPICAAGYIELLGKKLKNTAFSCDYSFYYAGMDMEDFSELLADAKFCEMVEKVLEVRYGVSMEKIKALVNIQDTKERICIPGFVRIFEYLPNDFTFFFLDIFQRALLQKEFEVSWEINENGCMEYYITKKRSDSISEVEKVFLPLTFVNSMNNNESILTEASIMGRVSLNANHPFSVWLIQHAIVLSKKHKALWKRLRENICKLDSEKMVIEVNAFLREIEKRDRISIPSNVWLSQKDFLDDLKY